MGEKKDAVDLNVVLVVGDISNTYLEVVCSWICCEWLMIKLSQQSCNIMVFPVIYSDPVKNSRLNENCMVPLLSWLTLKSKQGLFCLQEKQALIFEWKKERTLILLSEVHYRYIEGEITSVHDFVNFLLGQIKCYLTGGQGQSVAFYVTAIFFHRLCLTSRFGNIISGFSCLFSTLYWPKDCHNFLPYFQTKQVSQGDDYSECLEFFCHIILEWFEF